jgi:hypothetical protein
MQGDYIQFGCGVCAPPSWRNFDASPTFWLQSRLPFLKPMLLRRGFFDYPKNIAFGDVVKGLPVNPQSAKAIYCSHVLEHLTLEEFRAAVRNVFNYLQHDGCFRLVVPDLEFLANQYVTDMEKGASSRFLEKSLLGEKAIQRGLIGLPRQLFGRSKHYWMWDYRTIEPELSDAGFVDIRRAEFGDSGDSRFTEVENPGRWENCLGVECRRQ